MKREYNNSCPKYDKSEQREIIITCENTKVIKFNATFTMK